MHNINVLHSRSYLILLKFSYSSRRIKETGNPRLIPRISPVASSLRSLGSGQGGQTWPATRPFEKGCRLHD